MAWRPLRWTAMLALAVTTLHSVAGVEVNTASQADLETLRGIGPALSSVLLAERERAPFQDWPELLRRVRGLGARSAARLSDAGLTVNGSPYVGAPAPGASAP